MHHWCGCSSVDGLTPRGALQKTTAKPSFIRLPAPDESSLRRTQRTGSGGRGSKTGSTETSHKPSSKFSLCAALRRAFPRLHSFFRKEPLDGELNEEMT